MNHFELTDEEFVQQLEDCNLLPTYFSHEAHLRLAWLQIQSGGVDNAIYNVSRLIRNYTKHLGAESKYNETVTVAAVKAVNHFMQRFDADNFQDFILHFPVLKVNFKELLFHHYSTNIFEDVEAKSSFLEPDLMPF